MSEPFEKRARFFQMELRKERRAVRALQQVIQDRIQMDNRASYLLMRTEQFLMSEGYRRIGDGQWTKEPYVESE